MFCSSLALQISRNCVCARRAPVSLRRVVFSRSMSNGLLERPVEHITKPEGAGSQFNVVSYNILSDKLRQEHPELYSECDEKFLSWKYRGPQLVREIESYEADVICLQEVEREHFDSTLCPGLEKHGFKGFHVPRKGNHPDGCATFYRTEKFDLIKQQAVEYHQPHSPLLDRDNVALLLLLRAKQSEAQVSSESTEPVSTADRDTPPPPASDAIENGTDGSIKANSSNTVVVSNTHLLFNPRRGDVKLAQLMLLMAEIRQLSKIEDGSNSSNHPAHHPVVLTGDFNLTPFSPLYWFLATGGLFYEGVNQFTLSGQERNHRMRPLSGATKTSLLPGKLGISNRCAFEDTSLGMRFSDVPAITHPLGLASSYQHYFSRNEPEFTTFHNHVCCTVDYIMFSSDQFQPRSDMETLHYPEKLALVGRRRLVQQAQLKPIGALPNEFCPSDHLAIQAFFQFRSADATTSDQSRPNTPGTSKRTRR